MEKAYIIIGALAIILIVALVLVFSSPGGGNAGLNLASLDNKPVPQSLVSQLNIPSSASSAVGIGLASNFPRRVTGPPLRLNGKPEVLYIGAEYCPYCAIERWALVIALMRFGNFTGLEYMTSSPTDLGPNTPTFTFLHSTYSSPYISFVARETESNVANSSTGGYPPLEQLNSTEVLIASTYAKNGGIPFLDFANKSVEVGASYNDPEALADMNWSTIAGKLHNSSSVQAMGIVGSANLLTAQICMLTNQTPQSVCGQGYVQNIESELS